MAWLHALDVHLFHFVNLTLRHPALDGVMRFLSWNVLFGPVVAALGLSLLWKGGRRGRVLGLMLAIILPLGDGFVVNPLKHAIGRERPGMALPDTNLVMGNPDSLSMPSAHASNWFAATMILFFYYRRSWWVMLPLAVAVSFSRIYVGAHYPADVLVGAILGPGYAVAGMVGLDALWRWVGRGWFPLWWGRMPSLLNPELEEEAAGGAFGGPYRALYRPFAWVKWPIKCAIKSAQMSDAPYQSLEQHWLRLGYVVIAASLLGRLAFIASGTIELSKDEAYQWLWSKHLALSYYSKPPMIAYTQRLGTFLWGDTAFGVRFFAPVIGAVLGVLLLRWVTRLAGARTAFWLVVVLLATPLLGVGSTLLTIDPLLVMFWTVAMVLGWRAVAPDGTTWDWLGVGLAMGLAFLSKYSALYQIVCFALFFVVWPAARLHLRRPGPWLALLVLGICTVPVLVWNAQNGWITLSHVSQNASLQERWHPTLRYLVEFTAAELGLLNPVFLVAALWAMAGLWKLKPESDEWRVTSDGGRPGTCHSSLVTQLDVGCSAPASSRRGVMIYLFCMGAPVFIGHWLYTLHSQVQPNWIAPAVVPMFCLMVLYWDERWRRGAEWILRWRLFGVVLGLTAVVVVHEPELLGKVLGQPLPPDKDPLRRVRAWKATAELVEAARANVQVEGKPVFIVVHHYGITGLLSFYDPEARTPPGREPLVYSVLGPVPENQFFFWPEYRYQQWRKGENALFVIEADLPPYSMKAWWRSVLTGDAGPLPAKPPSQDFLGFIPYEFESVKDLGVFPVLYRGQVYRWVQLVACRKLR